MKKVLAFSFSAGEFLDEELFFIKDKFGEDIKFLKDGEYRKDETSAHPFQYWSSQEGCDELNNLYKS